MVLSSIFAALRGIDRSEEGPESRKEWHFSRNLWATLDKNWYLGFTSFGGPSVHFKIFHQTFVEKYQWLDEQMYQELFAICQALSGPGSTKMHYCINLIRNGFVSAIVGFLIWSLPGAIGMYGLSVGISRVGEVLPGPVYALLSGLNAATVGIIALAAVQLAQKAITDKVTRVLVFLGATAGMLYNALWYFPLLLFLAGAVTVVYDFRWLHPLVKKGLRVVRRRDRSRDQSRDQTNEIEMDTDPERPLEQQQDPAGEQRNNIPVDAAASSAPRSAQPTSSPGKSLPRSVLPVVEDDTMQSEPEPNERQEPRLVPADRDLNIPWQFGLVLIVGFLVTFVTIMVLRGVLKRRPLLFSLFANLYLAGTIIFGGGPVVIPLLREYIVAEGWVSSRDFLLGLAIIQAFPGPNFNFAVYLGSLTAINGGLPSAAGAVIGYIAIFAPGLITVHGTMGLWRTLRTRRWVKSGLRGVNAAAVGLIYTAVYRLWEIGYVDETFTTGSSLGRDPWWVVVTATSYVGGYWFGLSVPLAILLGGAMGLIWYGVVSA